MKNESFGVLQYWLIGGLFTAALAGCASPHPAFMGMEKQVITVQGSTFHVRIKENFAEAIRTNFERIPKIGDTFPKAEIAIEQASGCKVVADSMKGDPALMVAKIDCF